MKCVAHVREAAQRGGLHAQVDARKKGVPVQSKHACNQRTVVENDGKARCGREMSWEASSSGALHEQEYMAHSAARGDGVRGQGCTAWHTNRMLHRATTLGNTSFLATCRMLAPHSNGPLLLKSTESKSENTC